MFGADTPLVMEALQLAGLAAAGSAAAVYLALRLRNNRLGASKAGQREASHPSALEDRVRNLERVATDRSHDLAAEIEALRDVVDAPGEHRKEHA